MVGGVPFDVLEVGVQLLLPLFFVLLHELEVLAHLRELLAEQLGPLLVLGDCGFVGHFV
jgi:hypothetical protein